MAKRIAFSKQTPTLQNIFDHHADIEAALYLFFSPSSPSYAVRFFSYRPDQIRDELHARLGELELTSILSIHTAVEAAFQIDYLQRCQQKKKDL